MTCASSILMANCEMTMLRCYTESKGEVTRRRIARKDWKKKEKINCCFLRKNACTWQIESWGSRSRKAAIQKSKLAGKQSSLQGSFSRIVVVALCCVSCCLVEGMGDLAHPTWGKG